MKTIKVRPILLDSTDKIKEGTLITDSLGKLRVCTNLDENVYRFDSGSMGTLSWKAKQLILISLNPDEKIEEHAIWIKWSGGKWRVFIVTPFDYRLMKDLDNQTQYYKVITTQSQLSSKLIQNLIEQYNDNGMEDFDIEIVDKYTDPIGNKSDVPLDDSRLIYEPKLINGFVTCIAKQYPIGGFAPGNYENICVTCKSHFLGDKLARQCERCATLMVSESEMPAKNFKDASLKEIQKCVPPTYTEEEVKVLIWKSKTLFSYHKDTPFKYLRNHFNTWFEQNKKK